VGTHLLAQSRGGEPVGTPVHALLGAADVAADGGKSSAGVLDEAAYHHVGPQVRGLDGLHELAVAVVHHDFHVRLDPLAEGDQFPDLPDREGGAGGVPLRPLDGDELGAAVDLLPDGVVVEGSVGLQVRLGIGDAILLQGAFALPDADDLLQGVIGGSHRGQQLVPRQQVGGEGHCQGMGAAGDLGTDQSRLRVEHIGVHSLQVVPAVIVVAVAGGGGKVGGVYPVFLHGGQDLALVVLCRLINDVEPGPQVPEHRLAVFIDRPADAELFIHG
ncbi:Peptidase propeptide and YPEB domain, partial [Dysosmobacter welbionis]